MKQLFTVFITFFIFTTIGLSQKVVLVLDAGHGGSDPGHLSSNPNHLAEKDLNLVITKLVGEYIDQYLMNVEVIYTRKDDHFVSLDDRVQKTNSSNANYLISIHCNASEKKHIHGTESHIHDYTFDKSVALAKEMENQFENRAGRKSRGIKDNGDREHTLQMLKYTKMAGILVECGYLTNEKEANYLNTKLGQEVIASAIFRGFRTFIQNEFPKVCFVKDKAPVSIAKSNKSSNGGVGQNYTIQLMSSKTPLETSQTQFQGLGMNVFRLDLNTKNAYKYLYTAGTFTDLKEAEIVLEKVKKKGFKDAIIIKKNT